MKEGDKVKFTMYDKHFTGLVEEVYDRAGWEGYANVTVEGKYKIDIAKAFLEVVPTTCKKDENNLNIFE